VGRLLCRPSGGFEIQLDLLDGNPLRFDSGQASRQTPFVYDPVPPLPQNLFNASDFGGPEKRLRPYFFWAGLHISAAVQGHRSSVLLFVPSQIEGYANDFLHLLEAWRDKLPDYFEAPSTGSARKLWEDALATIDDYFGEGSYQARLARRGVLMHHGSMPGRLGRMLSELVDGGIINVVLATSTLSEGINLPFETVLIPSLFRAGQPIPKAEIANLIGRAGRPGVATEGRGLVLLYDTPQRDPSAWRATASGE
jgi:hypothetical protein